jgi:hypothetical protein
MLYNLHNKLFFLNQLSLNFYLLQLFFHLLNMLDNYMVYNLLMVYSRILIANIGKLLEVDVLNDKKQKEQLICLPKFFSIEHYKLLVVLQSTPLKQHRNLHELYYMLMLLMLKLLEHLHLQFELILMQIEQMKDLNLLYLMLIVQLLLLIEHYLKLEKFSFNFKLLQLIDF